MVTHVRYWLALLSFVVALGSTSGVLAHAQLLSSSPAANAVADAAPDMAQLLFNEPVTALAVTLIAPDGSRQDLIGKTTSGEAVTIDFPGELARGTHVLSWRVVSADGHPIGSSLIFSVGEITGAAADMASDPAVAAVLWAGKGLFFIALFIGIGGVLFGTVAPLPPLARRVSLSLVAVGPVVAAATLGLQGLDALGLPLVALLDGRSWAAAMTTSYAATTIVAAVACLAALGALGTPPGREAKGLALLAAMIAALSLALSGHASAAEPQWLTRPAVFLHIGGVLFWVGALLPLLVYLRSTGAEARTALAAFSRLIPFAIASLVASGGALAVVQMGWPGPGWFSPYGAILAAKLVLLVLLFGLALWNRFALTRPALAGEAPARRRLGLSVRAEIIVALVILGLVAGWRFTPPPRALAEVEAAALAEPLMLHLMTGNDMAMVTVTPGRAGQVSLEAALMDAESIPTTAEAVTVVVSAPSLGIEPFKAEAVEVDGAWRVEALPLPLPGTWHLALEIRQSRFTLVKLASDFEIPE